MIGKRPLVYLDNAASAQRPRAVLERLERYYFNEHSNIHRGVHTLSQEATQAYESAREAVAAFLGAPSSRSCIFTRGTTEGINLVASTWGERFVGAGDEILLTEMEHHANIVPWQLLAERKGARIVVAPVTDDGEVDLEALERLFSPRTRLLSFVHVSNALGTINPAKAILALAKRNGVVTLLDAAQSVPHMAIDVGELECDFAVFSGHKIGGPTGIGVLFGRPELLAEMPPWQGGGDMIERVRFSGTTFREPPERFEAGTPNIEGAIGLHAAIDYLNGLDREGAEAHERRLLLLARSGLEMMDGVRIWGNAKDSVSLVSFTIEGAHHSDLGILLDMDGVAVRTGHHCCMPLWERFGIEGTARASFAFYNSQQDVELFVESVARAVRMLR